MKSKIKDWAVDHVDDDILYQATVQTRNKPETQKRWMEYCNVDSPEKIDYENPMVKIEFWLLDFKLYDMALEDPKLFCDTLGCDYDVFMKEYDPLPTREVRAKELKRQVKRKLNPIKRNKSKP